LEGITRLFYNSESKTGFLIGSIPYDYFTVENKTSPTISITYYGTNDLSVKENDEHYKEDPETGEEFTPD